MTQLPMTGNQPSAQSMPPTPPLTGDYAGWLFTAALVAAGSVLWLRRRVSRDNTEIVKDRAEGTMLAIALAERDKAMSDAREAWAQRTKDASEIAFLRAENQFLTREVERLKFDLARLENSLSQVLGAMRMLNPDFQLVPQPITGDSHGT